MTLPASLKDRDICVLGLGYVGLTLAIALADRGFRVHGTEVRDEVLQGLAEGRPHFWEPRLAEKLTRVKSLGRFSFSKDIRDSGDASVYFITVGTPLDENGNAKLSSVEQATRQVAEHLRDDGLVILRSTVKLGTARNVVRPILEGTGKRFELAVCPERTLEGRALVELYDLPQIIGSDIPETRFRCSQLFAMLTPTTVTVSSLEAAELVKLVDNTYRDVSFAFANEVARLCSHAGISAREVIRAGRLGYPRTNVALPGPVGGPCLEKDPHILVESARQWNVEMPITSAAREVNESQPLESAGLIRGIYRRMAGANASPRIHIAGLAFKGAPPTDDLRGTMAKPIYEALREMFPDSRFAGFDPVVKPAAIETFFGFPALASLEALFTEAEIVVIANNHPAFQTLDIAAWAARMPRPALIYDFWNMHDDTEASLAEGARYVPLGSEGL